MPPILWWSTLPPCLRPPWKVTRLIHLIASKVNYMRKTSITCRHAGCYKKWDDLNPVVVTVTLRSQKSLHIDHHMILRPYHSHHTLQKQVKRKTYSTVGVCKAVINRIAMKISSDWSNQTDLGHSQCPLFSLVNHIDYRDRYIGEDRTTRVRYVG